MGAQAVVDGTWHAADPAWARAEFEHAVGSSRITFFDQLLIVPLDRDAASVGGSVLEDDVAAGVRALQARSQHVGLQLGWSPVELRTQRDQAGRSK